MKSVSLNPLEEILDWLKLSLHKLSPEIERNVLDKVTLDIPPPHIRADYALSVFTLGETFQKNLAFFARRIEEYCSNKSLPLIRKISTAGPYINIEVNKNLYCKKILDHIHQQGRYFGNYRKGKPGLISLNRLGQDVRSLIISHALGAHYERGGHTVIHNALLMNDDKLIPLGKKVINNALKTKIARYVSDTDVIITVPTEQSPSIVLQKQDKSLTAGTLYLAQEKKTRKKKQLLQKIYIAPKEHAEMIHAITVNAKALKYIYATTKTSTIFIDPETNINKYITESPQAAHYALLRIPSPKKALLTDESMAIYTHLTQVICQLREGKLQAENRTLNLGKLLIAFPNMVADVVNHHKIENLCSYLEKIAQLCQNRLTDKGDKHLSLATAIVLENGLKSLTSGNSDI